MLSQKKQDITISSIPVIRSQNAAVAADIIKGPWACRGEVELELHTDFTAIEAEWHALEEAGDCAVFQSFGWVSTWQKHIGARQGIELCIVTGRDFTGEMLFLLPLGIKKGV